METEMLKISCILLNVHEYKFDLQNYPREKQLVAAMMRKNPASSVTEKYTRTSDKYTGLSSDEGVL